MLQPLNAVEALETTIVLSMAQPASDRTNVIAQGSDHVDEAAGPGMGRAGLLDVSSTLGTRQKRGVGGAPSLSSSASSTLSFEFQWIPWRRRLRQTEAAVRAQKEHLILFVSDTIAANRVRWISRARIFWEDGPPRPSRLTRGGAGGLKKLF